MGLGDLVFQYKYSNKVLFYLNISHFDFFEIFLVGKWSKQKYKMFLFSNPSKKEFSLQIRFNRCYQLQYHHQSHERDLSEISSDISRISSERYIYW